MDFVALGSHCARRGGLRRAGLALRKPAPAACGRRRRTRLRTPTGAPRVSHESHAPHRGRGPGRSFNLPESRLSKSVAKARIGPKRRKRNVDIPRFFSRPIPARSAFATDLDKSPPRIVPGAPCAPPRPHSTRTVGEDNSVEEEFLGNHRRAGGLARRDRVCYAPFPLLRSSALRYAPFSRTAEGEGAKQTRRGVADDPARRLPRGSWPAATPTAVWTRSMTP